MRRPAFLIHFSFFFGPPENRLGMHLAIMVALEA